MMVCIWRAERGILGWTRNAVSSACSVDASGYRLSGSFRHLGQLMRSNCWIRYASRCARHQVECWPLGSTRSAANRSAALRRLSARWPVSSSARSRFSPSRQRCKPWRSQRAVASSTCSSAASNRSKLIVYAAAVSAGLSLNVALCGRIASTISWTVY